MRTFLRQLTVPAIVLFGTALFWLHVQEAPSVARRVPNGVMIFIGVMTLIVVARAFVESRRERFDTQADRRERVVFGTLISEWLRDWAQRITFIVLAIGYFFAFSSLGFSLSNFLFLCAALLLAGFERGKPKLKSVVQIGGIALFAAIVFHFLALLMDFNVPTGPFGI